jgi:hypothetical protein
MSLSRAPRHSMRERDGRSYDGSYRKACRSCPRWRSRTACETGKPLPGHPPARSDRACCSFGCVYRGACLYATHGRRQRLRRPQRWRTLIRSFKQPWRARKRRTSLLEPRQLCTFKWSWSPQSGGRRPGQARQNRPEHSSKGRVPTFQSLPVDRQDVRRLQRLCHRPSASPQARRQRYAGQHAVADNAGSETKRSDGVVGLTYAFRIPRIHRSRRSSAARG